MVREYFFLGVGEDRLGFLFLKLFVLSKDRLEFFCILVFLLNEIFLDLVVVWVFFWEWLWNFLDELRWLWFLFKDLVLFICGVVFLE